MKALKEVLENKEQNFLFPFFWIRGEDEKTIRNYVNKVYETGIREICIESRPHPEYLKTGYWEDIEIILDEVEKLNMRVWFVDDEHFPTGSAAGRVKKEFPHLQKKYIRLHQIDVHGPQKNSFYDLKFSYFNNRNQLMESMMSDAKMNKDLQANILRILAAKQTDFNSIEIDTLIDITEYIENNILTWEVPEGRWKILVISETFDGGEEETQGYLNPLVKEATNVLIDTVYERHYEKFGDKFGKTIAGFFSDEPRFGNVKGPDASIGRLNMDLPWSEEVLSLLVKKYGPNALKHLPLLFIGEGVEANKIRYQYMDIVSNLYKENFSEEIGKWCQKHNVEYTGHIIEDNNAHSRLGYGPGHFFRSMSGQTIAGVDVVLHQLMPGYDDGYFHSMTSTGWDGEFFHYALAKLGSSLGHLDENKKGRSMVELFGAYGWNEGLPLMKWLADHMLVRGINYFVPHAFSLKDYPDPDCPPHLYAHGNNPQYKYLNQLVSYMNKSSHLLSKGIHRAEVAVLYHAESEWSGDYQLVQKPARELMENQIDFDIVPADYLNDIKIGDKKLWIGKENFKKIIIPFSEALPERVLSVLSNIQEKGVGVLFIDTLPTRITEGGSIDKYRELLNNDYVVPLEKLSTRLLKNDIYTIKLKKPFPYLRVLNKVDEDTSYYMITNEHPSETLENSVFFKEDSNFYAYDAMLNEKVNVPFMKKESETKLDLKLTSGQSIIIVFNKTIKSSSTTKIVLSEQSLKSNKVTIEINNELKEYDNISKVEVDPMYSGTINYELEFNNIENYENALLNMSEVNEIAEVYLNEMYVGTRIAKPYIFDISKHLKHGKNKLRIKVTNNLGNIQQDYFSQYLPTKINGIYEEVNIQYYKDQK